MVTPETLKAFGRDVRAARAAAGLTLAQLALEAFGNEDRKGYVSSIENGRKPITPLTVGKLAEALDLPDNVTHPMYDNNDTAQDDPSPLDDRAAQLLATTDNAGDSGVAEGLMIALAYEYAESDTTDLDSAYRGLKAALETARDMAVRARLPDNTDAAMSAIRAEVQALNEVEKLEAAEARINQALAQKQAEVAALLDLGLQQARIRNDPQAAAQRVWERVRQETKDNLFGALGTETNKWINHGRDKGLRFDSTVAIHLAEFLVANAKTQDERGKAFGTLGLALSEIGERESSTERLEEAVKAHENALLERHRECVPLDWARTQMNLGTALQTLGERESGTDKLEQAVAAYEAALEERTREKVPLDWATTQVNLGNALLTLGERESGTDRLEQAVATFGAALKERTREKVPLEWAKTQVNLGSALKTLGQRESGTYRLEQAVAAYEAALEELTREKVPLQWAMTQHCLSGLEIAFFQKSSDPAHLDRAEVYAKDARAVYVEAGATHYIGWIEEALTTIAALRDGLA